MEQLNENLQYKYYVSYIEQGISKIIPLSINLKEVQKDKINIIFEEKLDENNNKLEVKNYIRFSSNSIYDESEIIRSEIAELLGLDVPKVLKVLRENVNTGVKEQGILFNCNLKNKDLIIPMSKNFSIKMSAGKTTNPIYKLPLNSLDNPITDSETISQIIRKGYEELPFYLLKGQPNEKEDTIKLVKDYFGMIVFDLINGQVTRNGIDYEYTVAQVPQSNQSIRTKAKINIVPGIGNYRFVSSDSKENVYSLNDYYVDKDALLNVLFERYYQFIEDVVKPINEATQSIKRCIGLIISNNTSNETKEYLENLYFSAIDKICALEKQKNQNVTRVELTSTTQKYNILVASRITKIEEKYKNVENTVVNEPIEQNTDELTEIETEDRVVLRMDPKSDKKENGYVSVALISSVIAFVCGLGIGIAYMIINLT